MSTCVQSPLDGGLGVHTSSCAGGVELTCKTIKEVANIRVSRKIKQLSYVVLFHLCECLHQDNVHMIAPSCELVK